MYKHILILSDSRVCSEQLFKHGLNIAKAGGAEVTIIYVLSSVPPPVDMQNYGYVAHVNDMAKELQQAAEQVLARGAALARWANVPVHTKLVTRRDFKEIINDILSKYDLIVMRRRKHIIESWLNFNLAIEDNMHQSGKAVLTLSCFDTD